jgi:hypothetical protein
MRYTFISPEIEKESQHSCTEQAKAGLISQFLNLI